jgi:hypothetical protein
MKHEKDVSEWSAWVHSLSWRELQNASEFTIPSPTMPDDETIWRDLSRLHTPLPTPIFPAAACPHQAAADRFVDHANEARRRRRDARHRPQLFQLIPTATPTQPSSSIVHTRRNNVPAYRVHARRFRSAAGDQWGLGCTWEQREADWNLTNAFRIVHLPESGQAFGRLFLIDDGKERYSPLHKIDFLRCLVVASRGHWGTKGPPNKNKSFARWLEPTHRWFSLPMYIASRLEAALWATYLIRQRKTGAQPPSLWESALWNSISEKLTEEKILHLIAQSIGQGLQTEIMVKDRVMTPMFRDTVMYGLLDGSVGWPLSDHTKNKSLWMETLLTSRVLDISSPEDRLRASTREALHLLLTHAVEEALLQELTQNDRTSHKLSRPKSTKRPTRNRNKKRSIAVQRAIVERSLPPLVPEDEELSCFYPEEESERIQRIHFSNNGVSVPVRNRNIVLSLSILEEVLSAVFVKVGLTPIELPFAEHDAKLAQRRAQQSEVDRARKEFQQRRHTELSQSGTTRQTLENSLKLEGERTQALTSQVMSQQECQEQGGSFFSGQQSPFINRRRFDSIAVANASATSRSFAGLLSPRYETVGGEFIHRSEAVDSSWELSGFALDGWGRIQGFTSRDRSIMEDFFDGQTQEAVCVNDIMASSTAASIASSTEVNAVDVDVETIMDEDGCGLTDAVKELAIREAATAGSRISMKSVVANIPKEVQSGTAIPFVESAMRLSQESMLHVQPECEDLAMTDVVSIDDECHSPSPPPPSTPSPTLSPILVSLADLQEMRKESVCRDNPVDTANLSSYRSFSAATTSLPNSPRLLTPPRPQIPTSLSRDNLKLADDSDQKTTGKESPASFKLHLKSPSVLRKSMKVKSMDDTEIKSKSNLRRFNDGIVSYVHGASRLPRFHDDHAIRPRRSILLRSPDVLTPYRTAATRAVASSNRTEKFDSLKPFENLNLNHNTNATGRSIGDGCARSEIAGDAHDDYLNWNDSRRSTANDDGDNHTVTKDGDNHTVTKDGSTTITSALSQREPEEVSTLREERDAYRDMCLTMGAEVAKLKNILAAQKSSMFFSVAPEYADPLLYPVVHTHSVGPDAVKFENIPRARTLAAMSDAGYKGEYESLASDDDGGRLAGSRHPSSSVTGVGSDVSVENCGYYALQSPLGAPLTRDLHDLTSLRGMQSRLSKDILHFLDATNMHLRKQDSKRMKAVERMTRLVNTVWPRAQVKVYGSHVTGLCLPSSDLDFVICLPAVHKRAPAVAPGALEGRNAINETSQKLLARKLKSESWIDPRSMKLIERAVVPVITVSTKDTKARTIQLDISFDGPGHHGLQAIDMVSEILEELPMLRPLVLILKQFLLDRGLLTAYTGGLSSYCLFLMVARYLQEQQTSWGDCGSLLMGFLDFYGNCFDPRTTGISVRHRQYFPRPNYSSGRMHSPGMPVWSVSSTPVVGNPPLTQFLRLSKGD